MIWNSHTLGHRYHIFVVFLCVESCVLVMCPYFVNCLKREKKKENKESLRCKEIKELTMLRKYHIPASRLYNGTLDNGLYAFASFSILYRKCRKQCCRFGAHLGCASLTDAGESACGSVGTSFADAFYLCVPQAALRCRTSPRICSIYMRKAV